MRGSDIACPALWNRGTAPNGKCAMPGSGDSGPTTEVSNEESAMTDYPELVSRVSAPEGSGREIRDPATNEVIGRAPVQTAADLDASIARGPRAPSPCGPHSATPGAARSSTRSPTASTPRRGARTIALARAGQAAERTERPFRGRRVLGVASCDGGDRRSNPRSWWTTARPRRDHLQGARRRRCDRAVELAPDDRHLADRPVAPDGEHRHRQTVVLHPAERDGPDLGDERGAAARAAIR